MPCAITISIRAGESGTSRGLCCLACIAKYGECKVKSEIGRMKGCSRGPSGFRGLYPWVRCRAPPVSASSQTYITRTSARMFGKKVKKPHSSLSKNLLLGIPTSIAVSPLGFRTELDADPKGESPRSCYRVDQPDLTGF